MYRWFAEGCHKETTPLAPACYFGWHRFGTKCSGVMLLQFRHAASALHLLADKHYAKIVVAREDEMVQDLNDMAKDSPSSPPAASVDKERGSWWSEARGRRTKWAVATVLVAFLAGALLFGVYVDRYRPIERGNQSLSVIFEHRPGNPLSREYIYENNPILSQSEVVIRFRPGGSFRYGFSIRNGGRWPVTVTGLPLPIGAKRFVVQEDLKMGLRNDVIGAQAMTGFRPFRLAPGQQRYMEIDYRMTECATTPEGLHDGAIFGWKSQGVDYEVFGISGRMEFALVQGIAINYLLKGLPAGC